MFKPESDQQNFDSEKTSQDCSERLFEAVLPNNLAAQDQPQNEQTSKEKRDAQADKLIAAAEKEFADPEVLPIHVRENFIKALEIKESIYGKQDERLLPVLDRLCRFSPAKETVKYKEQAADIVKAKTDKSVHLATRCTDLADRYHELKDEAKSKKFLSQAIDIWRKQQSFGSEFEGDKYAKQGDMGKAIGLYEQQLDLVTKEIGAFIKSNDGTKSLHANPLEARLHQKLGDVYLSTDNLAKAETAYTNASALLQDFSAVHNDHQILPEQLSVAASAIIGQLKATKLAELQQNDPNWRTNEKALNHLMQGSAHFKELFVFEAHTETDQSIKNTNYGKDHPQLLEFMDKVANAVSNQGDHSLAVKILQRKYDMQMVKHADKVDIIKTMDSLSRELFETEETDKAIDVYAKAIDAAGDDPLLIKNITMLPKLVVQSLMDNNLDKEQQYKLATVLLKFAQRQIDSPTFQESAVKNFEYAVNNFSAALKKGLVIDAKQLADAAALFNIYNRQKDGRALALMQMEQPLQDLAAQFATKIFEIYKADPKQNGDALIQTIDRVSNLYFQVPGETIKSIPLLRQALIIEKEQNKSLQVLSKRVDAIANAQDQNAQYKEKIETYNDFLKYIDIINGGKDSIEKIHVLHQLSASWSVPPFNNGQAPPLNKEEVAVNDRLLKALEYKTLEANSAMHLEVNNKFEILFEKAMLEQNLNRNEDLKKSLNDILKGDWSASRLPADSIFLSLVKEYYLESQKYDEGVQFGKQVIAVQHRNNEYLMIVHARLITANFLEKQNNIADSQKELETAKQEVNARLTKLEAAGEHRVNREGEMLNLLYVLDEQAQFLERQQNNAPAESAWRTKLETIEGLGDNEKNRDLLQNCWQHIAQNCRAQGKSKEADIAEQMFKILKQ